ncbi:MAG: outer membrane beta-barrel protein [Ignavibacteriae bacterium]|nr:outer membrane beta-barrel protein [Ignavibacteriota bacterium]
MKKNLKPLLIILCFGIIIYSNANATSLGILIGLSTPSNQINNVYNSNSLSDFGNMYREGAKLGYHIGIRGRMDLSDNLQFVGGIAYHKFPQTTIQVINPNSPYDTLASLNTSQNVIPITAGVNFFLLKKFIGLYGVGELSYNYISNSVDVYYGSLPVAISKSPTDSRIGFGLGAGADLDVKLITINLEVKYNYINLIGQKAGEEAKAFVSVSLGAFF